MKELIIKSCSTCPLNSNNIHVPSFVYGADYDISNNFCTLLDKLINVSPKYNIDKNSIYRDCPLEDKE
jgi:hypothetical protein